MALLVRKRRGLGFAACASASALWGCGFFFGKIAMREMDAGAMVLFRFLFATLALSPFLVTHRPGLNRREWAMLLGASFLGVPLQFLIQFQGLQWTTVSHASLMVGTMPVILAVGAAIFAHERMDRLGWTAIAGSTAGAALIAWGGRSSGNAALGGDLMIVLSMLIGLFWILGNKKVMERHSAIVVTTYGTAAGTLMLCAIVPVVYTVPVLAHVSLQAWMALAASGLLCTAMTTLLWNWGMTQVPASQAGVLLNMEPVIGSLLGVLVLGDRLGPGAAAGGGLILVSAVVLTTRSKTNIDEELTAL